jgi:hypothetical protein
MKSLNYLLILSVLAAFSVCTTKKQPSKESEFEVSVKSIPGDTVVTTAVYCQGYILCRRVDEKLFVLDTLLNPVDSLTKIFSPYKIDLLTSYKDTIIFATRDKTFFIDTDFTIKKYVNQPFKYGIPYYVDSTYYVYACSAGEWGGSVFFWNRKTNKTYSYRATTVQQVLKFNDDYIVTNYLAHLSGFSDFLSIKDPAMLYELKDEKQKTFCNWYTVVDSLKSDTTPPHGVKYYETKFISANLVTFTRNNNLYTIYCTDSATILAKHDNFHLRTVDTLLKRKLHFYDAKTHLNKNRSVTSYEASWSSWSTPDKVTNYQNTGLVFINNNRITFLEFKTPHMRSKN